MTTGKLQATKLIVTDALGLSRVCGPRVAARWLANIMKTFKVCARSHSLTPADEACGAGPFPVRRGHARARIYGPCGVGGIREIWVRDVYLRDDFLSIPPDAQVVDLGANMGNFTVLALAHGPAVRVIAVEAQRNAVAQLRDNVSANGWLDRVSICERLIGGITPLHYQVLGHVIGTDERNPKPGVQISEEEFIHAYNIERIDFLKCDIEGSEFELFRPGSRLLEMAQQIAIEIHDSGGDLEQFEAMLREHGFELMRTHDSSPAVASKDRVVLARRRESHLAFNLGGDHAKSPSITANNA